MPMHKIVTSDLALQGEVTCVGDTRRVWMFRVRDPENPYFVLSVERAACLTFTAEERGVTGLHLLAAGCDMMLAEAVLALLQEALPPNESTDPQRVIENRPIEGNQTP